MTNKRIINVRPLFVAFVAIIFGILTFYGLTEIKMQLKHGSAYFICGIILFIFAVIFWVLSLTARKSEHKFFVVLKKHTFNFTLFMLFMIVGFIACSIKVNSVLNYKTYTEMHVISGKITQVTEYENYTKLILEDVEIDTKEQLKGKLITNVFTSTSSSNVKFKLGDTIMFNGEIDFDGIVTDKLNFAKYSHGAVYRTSVSVNNTQMLVNRADGMDMLRQDIKNIIFENFNKDNAGIVIGALLGDKDELGYEIQASFKTAGVSHIIAVSGLHIGFLVAMLLLVCKLCKIKLKYSIVIIAAVLAFYCALCQFTPSVMRASFMAIVLLFSQVLGERYDALSSLSLAGIFILLLFPFDLFTVSFQLSFLCVFSIITLAPCFSALLSKLKCPKLITNTLSLSICINLAILPICANTFYSVSLMGIFANLFVIPLFSLTYPILFSVTLIRLILPFTNILFVIPNILLHFTKHVINIFGSINALDFKIFNMGYLIVFFVITFGMVLQFLMVNRYIKGGILGVLAIVILTMFISNCLPNIYTTNSLNTYCQYSEESAVLTSDDNKIFLVGFDKYTTQKLLKEMRVSKVDYWIIYNFNLNIISKYLELADTLSVGTIVVPKRLGYTDYTLKALKDRINVVLLDGATMLADYEVSFPTYNNRVLGVLVKQKNANILFVDDLTKNQFLYLNYCNLPDVDYLLACAPEGIWRNLSLRLGNW